MRNLPHAKGHHAGRVLAGVLLATSMLLVACGDDPDGAAASAPPSEVIPVEPVDGPDAFPEDWDIPELAWEECDLGGGGGGGDGGECATLEVPVDWGDPDGPTLELALGRRPTEDRRRGTIVTNPGGPGAEGLTYLATDPFGGLEGFDQVSWDPRGIGRSNDVDCNDDVPEFLRQDPSPDDAAERADLEQTAEAVAARCAERAGDLLAVVNTSQVVFDLEAIRLALGGEPLDYAGFSYGTLIGLEYAAAFGGNVRTMVLDGLVDPSEGFEAFLTGQAVAFEEALDEAALRCSDVGRDECGVADLADAYDDVAAMVEEEPLDADLPVGPSELTSAAMLSAYRADGWLALGSALADALDGDGAALSAMAARYLDFGGYDGYAAVTCTDSPPPAGVDAFREFEERVTAVAPRFGPRVANDMLPCATWAVPSTRQPAPVSAPEAPGILLVANTRDAATPIDNAVAVSEMLPGSRLVVVDRDGHTAYGGDACATRVVDDYLLTAELPPEGTTC
jgi:pimeloyl-ACP methyl ester carboxylesterase